MQDKTVEKTIRAEEHSPTYLTRGTQEKTPLLVLGPPSLISLLPDKLSKQFHIISFCFPYKTSTLSNKFSLEKLSSRATSWIDLVLFYAQAITISFKQKPIIFGHSLAGMLVKWTSFHNQAPQYIAGAIAVCSPWHLEDEKTHSDKINKVLEFHKYPKLFYQDPQNLTLQKKIGTMFKATIETDFDESGLKLHLSFLNNVFKNNNLPNNGKLPDKTRIPLLEINAENDVFVPIQNIRKLELKNRTSIELKEGKHFVIYEHPNLITKKVKEWLLNELSPKNTKETKITLTPTSTKLNAPSHH